MTLFGFEELQSNNNNCCRLKSFDESQKRIIIQFYWGFNDFYLKMREGSGKLKTLKQLFYLPCDSYGI